MRHIASLLIVSLLLTACSKAPETKPEVKQTITICESGNTYTTTPDNTQAILNYINSTPRHPQVNASISSDFTYTPTQPGNNVDTSKLLADVKRGNKVINVEDYYTNEIDPQVQTLSELAQSLNSFHITYSNGSTISANDFITLSENEIVIDEQALRSKVTDITLLYDTVGKYQTNYTTYNGTQVHLNGGSWGTLTNTLAEQDYIVALAQSLQPSENRVPIMKEECKDSIPSRIIEVDIAAQHLYVREGNNLIMETDVVTGRPNGRSTPTGVFKVLEKRKEKDLRGPGYVSHVHRWMRLTWSGVGLHDATWRSRFGGNIYVTDGSHGCINLPNDFAHELYEIVNTGDCVIIYNNN